MLQKVKFLPVGVSANEFKQTIFEALGDSASDDAESINDVVVRQLDNLNQFVSQSSSFLSRQVELAQQAHEACMTISKSAQNVAQLTKTSQVLSINLRIEAARLGNKGSSFTALGQEVHAFSSAVLLAANVITESASSFSATIPEMRDQAVQMEEEMSALSDTFHSELSMLSQRTSKMQSSLETTLDQVEVTNSQILDCSNQTLGHLAFQDPVSQGIQRVQHNIQQMQSLVEGERVDFVSLASIKEDVGEDGRTEREAGEVDLF
jgi:methyl-accepting chemotaxis protein